MLEKKVLHRRLLVSPQLIKSLLHVDHRMITFYLQLNLNQCSHYITICTRGKVDLAAVGRLALFTLLQASDDWHSAVVMATPGSDSL